MNMKEWRNDAPKGVCFDDLPSIEPVLEEVKQRLLHHVSHLRKTETKQENDGRN